MVITSNTLDELWNKIIAMKKLGYCFNSKKDIKKDKYGYHVFLA